LIGVEMVRDRACKTPASEETARVVQRHAPAPGANQRDGA
jgi:hypothetical protein